jgi:hypothetical protein
MTFSFTHNGTVYHVHTETGEGATRVVVEEAPQSIDASEEME